jgi:hypothetical protein
MRSLQVILKIIVAASLLAHPLQSWSSSAKPSGGKKNQKKSVFKDAGNVWDRVRTGIQIPKFDPSQLQVAQGLPTGTVTPNTPALKPNATTIAKNKKGVQIKTTLLPPSTATLSHDGENRPRLHSTIGAVSDEKNTLKSRQRLSSSLVQQLIVDHVNSNATPETTDILPRVRTRLEFHPQADKQDNKVTSEAVAKQPVITTVAVTSTTPASTEKTALAPDINDLREAKIAAINERIGKQINWYAQRPTYLQQVAERARPYLYHIVSGLSANHLPTDLALLPIVESAYQPTAESPKSAAGLWQFIPSTGLDFDLTQDENYDQRLDIEASTKAAIRYLAMLKRHFNGDWLLALAAYNCGQGRVDDAIASNKAAGLPTDYWSLHLPEETQDYVPRFLALSSIFSNPTAYGLKLPTIKNEPYFVKVKVDRKFDIDYLANKEFAHIAELANLSYEQFVKLNPGYLKPKPSVDGPFTLLLPADNAKHLHQHLTHVAKFLAEPIVADARSVLHKTPYSDANAPQDLTLNSVAALLHNAPRPNSPLLSLNLDTNQTTPRIITQPILPATQAMTHG